MTITLAQYNRALARIHEVLDGAEWSADTCDAIAGIVREAGFVIREPQPATRRFNVTLQIVVAGGDDIEVEADNEEEARCLATAQARERWNAGYYAGCDGSLDLQEVTVNAVTEELS